MALKAKLLSSFVLPSIFLSGTALLVGIKNIEIHTTAVAYASAQEQRTQQDGFLTDAGLQIEDKFEAKKLDRVEVLEKFFEKYNSPLRPHSETFVEVADKYELDYRLLPSISCIESSCGKHLIPQSYNPFGWGIYGNKVTTFESYDKAIETVGKGLKENYIDRGFDKIEEIAPIYTPPSYVHWQAKVRYFMGEINKQGQVMEPENKGVVAEASLRSK